MAFHTLGVHRALQPWRIAGLRHWLLDCEDDLRTVRSAGTATPVAVPVASLHTAPPALPQAVASGAPSAARSALSTQPARQGPPPRPKSIASVQPAPASQTAAAPATALPESPPTLPLQQWPEAWRELLSRCPRSPVVLWTYPAMRDDYGGRSDPARRALLQRLLRDLAMPPGSHAFWPMSAPPYDVPENVFVGDIESASDTASAKLRVDPLFFHSGIKQLSPMVVVFFGSPPSELGLPAISVLNSEIFLGLRLVHVPSTDILAANLMTGPEAFAEGAGRHDRLVQFLKSQVSGLTL